MLATQRWAISADLNVIQTLGFNHIRVLTFTKAKDPFYAAWPDAIFLTFPRPTSSELNNLSMFLRMTANLGMTSEIVLLMPDHTNHYYQHGVTSADYGQFIDALWPSMWGGQLSRIYLGGDLRLGSSDEDRDLVANHRRWVLDLWPHLVAKCPLCYLGLELYTADRTLWNRGADSISWIRDNLARQPNYIGCQIYPTTRAVLRALGFENDGIVDWAGLTQDWITNLRNVAGSIEIMADEFGIAVGDDEFSEQDQTEFMVAALETFTKNNMSTALWEFGDHPAIGSFGLITKERQIRPAAPAMCAALADARSRGLRPGIQYIPPEWVGLQWLFNPK